MKHLFTVFLIVFTFVLHDAWAEAETQSPAVKLYAFDCGRIEVSNFAGFSDTGDYDNKKITLVDPCFLIVHPKGTLLWDTGLSDALIKAPKTLDVYHVTKSVALQDSLKKLNLKPSDITYVAISHSHFDHAGNLDQFPQSTWLLQKAELAYERTHPNPFDVDVSELKPWKKVKKIIIDGDYDLFNDGTVKLIKTVGHTPGHQSLMIKLPQSGVVILSGDAFHQRSSFEILRVPVFNTSRADTMASADRIKTLLKNTRGQLVIQHDQNDFDALPQFPQYLE